MTYIPPQGVARAGVSWAEVQYKLETEGSLNKMYDSDLDGIIDLKSIPTIPRTKLEYPTVDVSFAYLSAINKLNFDIGAGASRSLANFVLTLDSFTDKAVKCQCVDETGLFGRWVDLNNWYELFLNSSASTADLRINVIIAGTSTNIASEAVDIRTDSRHLLMFSISGSTLKGFRNDMTTAKISATNTEYAIGLFGILGGTSGGSNNIDALLGMLLAPSSPLQNAKAIVELEITGSGREDDSIRPEFARELIEISKLSRLPDFLYLEAKKYEILRNKGFTDEEMELILGHIPQHQVDLASVSWGAFDYKGENTMLVCIVGDNPYRSGAILRQVGHAKSKNLKIYKVPQSYDEAKEIYRQVKRDRPDIIAGKDNFAYQTLGIPDLEPLAVADYYDGFVEGIYNIKDLEKLPNRVEVNEETKKILEKVGIKVDGRVCSELEQCVGTWMYRLQKANVPTEEKDKHMKKFKRFLAA